MGNCAKPSSTFKNSNYRLFDGGCVESVKTDEVKEYQEQNSLKQEKFQTPPLESPISLERIELHLKRDVQVLKTLSLS